MNQSGQTMPSQAHPAGNSQTGYTLKDAESVFGLPIPIRVPVLGEQGQHVPETDAAYKFNPQVTAAIRSKPVSKSTSIVVRPRPRS